MGGRAETTSWNSTQSPRSAPPTISLQRNVGQSVGFVLVFYFSAIRQILQPGCRPHTPGALEPWRSSRRVKRPPTASVLETHLPAQLK